MLEKMRAATQGLIGRAIMGVVMGLIILSFAIWGIGDIFRGFGADKLAKVGGEEITVEAFRSAYQNQLQRLQQQLRRNITNEEARQFGLDRQILSRLVSEAALDQQARALDLAISDQEIAKAIMNDPALKGPTGHFDRARFDEILRNNGLSEKGFVREQRAVYLRQEITDALTHGLQLPKAMLEAIHRFQSESRSVDYVVLPATAGGVVPAPSPEALQRYFDDRAQSYSTHEYRGLVVLTVAPADIAKPGTVSDADAQKRYEEVKSARFGAPEKRAVEQVLFPDEAQAAAARAKLTAGANFDDILKDRNLTQKDVDLGVVTRDALIDKAVAEAAFALPEGQVSAPVKAQFGTVLLRVAKVIPSSVKPFSEVKDDLKREIAQQRAKEEIARLHDAIEDQRASGKTLAEAAKSAGLEARAVPAIDMAGSDPQGVSVADLPNLQPLLKAAFASDIGVDNDTLRIGDGGYQWFEITKVDKARQKSFDEVKDEVEKAWRDDEATKLLAAKADELTKRIDAGESLAAIAAAEGKLTVKRADGVKRSGDPELLAKGFTPPIIVQIFNVGLHRGGSARMDDGGRILFQVAAAEVPAFDANASGLVAIAGEIKSGFIDDVIAQYLAKLQNQLGVKINMRAFAAAAGASPSDY